MELETSSTVVVGSSKADTRISLPTALLRLNSIIWLAGLTLSFVLTIPVALRYEKSSALTILDGKFALDFEHFITKEHPYSSPSLNSWAAMDLKLFHAGKPGVILGSDDWLFTSEEFPLPSVRQKQLAINLDKIRNTVAFLQGKGIKTVILPIPAKAEIYSEHVPPRLRGHVIPLTDVTRYLDAHHMPWIPVEDGLLKAKANGDQVFFRTETHWTPRGALVTAGTVAGWLKDHDLMQWPQTSFTIKADKPQPLESDLENFIPVSPSFSSLLPAAETYTPYKVVQTKLSSDADSLFSNTANPVALVGTSYSADTRWNFAGWLRAILHTEIDNVSEKGKGPFDPMDKFLRMVKEGETGARLVIWEMPVRSLAMDYAALAKTKP